MGVIALSTILLIKSDSNNMNKKHDVKTYENISKYICNDGTEIYYVVIINENNVDKSTITIINSYLYTEIQINELLDNISKNNNYSLNYNQIINEWKWHYIAYSFGFFKDKTATLDVYFNSPDCNHGIFSWIMNNVFI